MIEVEVHNTSVEVGFIQNHINIENDFEGKNIEYSQTSINMDVSKNEININLEGQVIMNQLKFEWVEPPVTRNSPGIPGQASFDDDYFFICVSPNLWARTILSKGF